MLPTLPMEIVDYILSYGDPSVTIKNKAIVSQLNYYSKEYEYLRHCPFNFYYNWRKGDVIYFIFNRCYFKIQARGVTCNCSACIKDTLNQNLIKEDAMKKWKRNKKREACRIRAYNERIW